MHRDQVKVKLQNAKDKEIKDRQREYLYMNRRTCIYTGKTEEHKKMNPKTSKI